ncbi:ribonuclease H-like domain-containing protein [Tanacetum coccineum]|uniref:Ribonuclease H-like domain-containing protein n=1 Tax=Tanacetum coccineum TaxID=301880 RepID=A0ABQ5B3T3_9ASTR
MNELFSSLGIVHQTTCAYTPQQNEVAKKKHRHLLNVARSLLPSSILNGKSPFKIVYGFKPKLSHLRSFGCLCYSSVLNNSDKFSTRGFDTTDGSEVDFATSMGDNPSSEGNVPSSSNLNTQNAQNLLENTSQVQPDLRSKTNYCFSTTLNKSSEPSTYYEAVKNPNWIEAMNNEIEALNKNNMWTICQASCQRIQPEDLFQLDINNAFLYGDLSEDVYMTLPPGFDNQKGKVCKLNKSLYGLKQAPRQWNARFDKVFISLLIYVDDIVIAGNDLAEIEKFKIFLKSKFQIKDLGKLKYFLGIEVLDNKEGICLSQRKYCLELSHEYGLLAAKHVDTPLPENTTLNHIETDDDHLLDNIGNYQKLVGSGIQINKSGNLKLRAYADSDWARCPATRKSVSGYCVFLGDSLATWKSKKQSNFSGSSTEAEYRSMASAMCEIADVLTKALNIEQHKSLCVKHGMAKPNMSDSPTVSLPVIGLASDKLEGSLISPITPQEHAQKIDLFQAASNWFNHFQARL